jgi:endonuclease G, mitochondrial
VINEQTRGIIAGEERAGATQREIVKKRTAIGRHPRYRSMRRALAEVHAEESAQDFERKMDTVPDLEKIVQAVNRPALLVKMDSFEVPLHDHWNARLNAARAAIERAIRATGRVELREPPRSGHVGTAWLVAPGVVATNRHVAVEFCRRQQAGGAVFRATWVGRAYRPIVDLREEHGQNVQPLEFELDRVVYLADDDDAVADIALLGVKAAPGQTLPTPIPIRNLALEPGRTVAVIGFPAYDPGETDRTTMVELFEGIFDVKRLSPGEVKVPAMGQQWFFTHDCSTLGGSSGSVVLDLETGVAVGLHFSGTSGIENYAVSASALLGVLAKANLAAAPAAPVSTYDVTTEHEDVGDMPPFEGVEGTAADYAERDGYDEKFLKGNTKVPLPSVIAARQGELAPRLDGQGHELKYRHFSVVVNRARRFPMITGVNIDGTSLKRVPGGQWRKDPRIDKLHQVGNEVYSHNSLDRGHMVRRLDPVWGTEKAAKEANDDTFHYTNACPQDHAFNDEVWGDLEDHILDSAPEDLRLCVLTGPVLAADDPEYRGIHIPRSFWKVVAWRKNNKLKAAAFLLTQEEYIGNLEFNPYQFGTYQLTLADLAEQAGLDFGALLQADVLAGQEAARPRRAIRSVREIRV